MSISVKKEKIIELRPDSTLLDPEFESYKLSLEQLPVSKSEIRFGVKCVEPGTGQFSYEKTRCMVTHNYLYMDMWHPDNVFFIDTGSRIRRFHLHGNRMDPAQCVYTLESKDSSSTHPLPPSLLFPGAELCVASDGSGEVHVLSTGTRGNRDGGKWTSLWRDDTVGACVLLDAKTSVDEDGTTGLELLTARFEERKSPKEQCDEFTVVILDWHTLESSGNDAAHSFELTRTRTFEEKSYPHYVAVSKHGLSLAADAPFAYVASEWEEAAGDLVTTVAGDSAARRQPKYKWSQTFEDITLTIDLPAGATKKHVVYSLNTRNISVSVRPDLESVPVEVIAGRLYFEAEPEQSSWSITDSGQLVVCVQKKLENRTWPQVVEGEDYGEMVVDPDLAAKVHEQLKHLTTEVANTDEPMDTAQNLFNNNQLEECDDYFRSGASLKYFDAASNAFTHYVDLSRVKWLFNTRSSSAGESPALVLRHDVDAVVWQPIAPQETINSDRLWRHQATYNALGYVHASKQNLKFTVSAPNSSYAAMCECQHRVYIYRQPSPLVNASLKNRVLGKQVAKIMKQQVAVLDSNVDICGMCASNDRLYVLTATEMYVFKTASDVGA